jgi:PAT family beta-lactamase induction signal transducer AmpG
MTNAAAQDQQKESLRETLARFTEPKMAMMLVLGFTAGLPFLLYFSTLGVWLERKEVDVAIIGFFSWFGLSYSLKMFWAPAMDKFMPPGFGRIFGKRRAWILIAQICIAMALVGIGISDPTQNLLATALFSGLLAFSSASQDVVIDAWRIEAAADDDEQAPLAAAYQYGYKVGMIISGGVALFIAGIANFNIAYVAMAAIMGLAALVFAVWDRSHGVKAAAAAASALMATGLFVAFAELSKLFGEGSIGATIMGGLDLLFKAATALSLIAFVYFIARSLLDTSENQKFRASDLLKGVGFTGALFIALCAIAALIGITFPAVFTALFDFIGVEMSRRNIGMIAAGVAFAPLILCGAVVPWIRSLPRTSPHLRNPVYGAFIDFFWRHGWPAMLILCLVSFYRLSDIVMGVMAKPAYSAMGYAPEQIGLASGIYGVWIVFIGVAAAGLSAMRLGLKVSLVIGAIVSALGNLSFAWLVHQSSDSLLPIILAITADNIAGGYAGTIFIAYMSSMVNKSFAATQYAIFSSIWSLGPKILAGTSGIIVTYFSGGNEDGTISGYSSFFMIAAVLGLPAIILSFFADKMEPDREVDPIIPASDKTIKAS